MSNLMRFIWSVVTIIVYSTFMNLYSPAATIASGELAGRQFSNSKADALANSYGQSMLSSVNSLATLALVVLLTIIWWKPAKEWLGKMMMVMLAFLVISSAQKAEAFFEKTDRTEVVLILPNESAFWIPDTGDNKNTQARMDSESYLRENKLAVKRFQIPHQKLAGSGGNSWTSGWDYFVPTGRMIIVDRTPFSREWVDADDRGTSKLREGFPCQSKEGLNITLGISIGASVSEENAPKFLHRFGTKPPNGKVVGDSNTIENDGKIIFTSVYYGRSLKEVMDDVGRKKVQTLACREITSRTFDKANEEANTIMEKIEIGTRQYFDTVGITLDFIGWGDTFEFDKSVQEAVNRRYVAAQDKAIAELLTPHKDVIQAIAAASALQRFGEKSDGKLPTTIVGLPTDVGGLLGSLLKTMEPVKTPIN